MAAHAFRIPVPIEKSAHRAAARRFGGQPPLAAALRPEMIWRWLRPGESGGFSRPVGGGIAANTVAKSAPVTPRFEAVGITCKPKKAVRLPKEPHSPSESPRYFAAAG